MNFKLSIIVFSLLLITSCVTTEKITHFPFNCSNVRLTLPENFTMEGEIIDAENITYFENVISLNKSLWESWHSVDINGTIILTDENITQEDNLLSVLQIYEKTAINVTGAMGTVIISPQRVLDELKQRNFYLNNPSNLNLIETKLIVDECARPIYIFKGLVNEKLIGLMSIQYNAVFVVDATSGMLLYTNVTKYPQFFGHKI